jgi:phenylacetate-coenzyme A ligase PaaK-like adenylate-forming protein
LGDEASVRGFLGTLRQTQFAPPVQMLAYQRGLLERLVRHARAHVPFYRDSGRLDPLFRRDDSIDWARWPELVPVNRGDLRDSQHALRSEHVPPEQGRVFSLTTAGSTGEPVTVLAPEIARRWAWAALRLRDFEWHRIDTSQRLVQLYQRAVHSSRIELDDQATQRGATWNPLFGSLTPRGERFDVVDTLPITELLETVIRLQPRYLQVQPSALQLMIAHDGKRRLAELGLDAVFSFGEHFEPQLKRAAEAHLGCRILELFGTTECGYIAGSCPHCGGIHFHAEVALVEALDENNAPAKQGETGSLIITPLYNYVMPLIRYDHADTARLASGPCRIALPGFAEIYGKTRVPFVFPGGRTIRPTFPPAWVIDCLGAQAYQVAQVAIDRCEIRIVPGAIAPAEMRFDELTKRIRAMWWDGLQIDYRIVDALPRRSARSKIQFFVQEMPETARAN